MAKSAQIRCFIITLELQLSNEDNIKAEGTKEHLLKKFQLQRLNPLFFAAFIRKMTILRCRKTEVLFKVQSLKFRWATRIYQVLAANCKLLTANSPLFFISSSSALTI